MLTTLFCQSGRDSGPRFGLITLAAVALFFIVNSLSVHATAGTRQGIASTFGLLACVVVGLSARRRLSDSGRPANWAMCPVVALALLVACQVLAPFSGWLLLPLTALGVISFALVNWPSMNLQSPAKAHPQGYCGPKSEPVVVASRVEPSLGSERITATQSQNQSQQQSLQPDIGHSYWDEQPGKSSSIVGKLFKRAGVLGGELGKTSQGFGKQQAMKAGAAFCVVVASAVVWFSWPAGEVSKPDGLVKAENDQAQVVTQPGEAFDHRLVMPDTYELLLQDKTLAIGWPGDPAPHGALWDQLSAEGDQSCTAIRFNDGTSYRSIRVEVKAGDQYLAYFSALDTAGIVKDVAMRGRFELCGYTFSLKGSMAQLESSPAFSRWL